MMSTEDEAAVAVTSGSKKVRGGHKAHLKRTFKDIDDSLRDSVLGRKTQLMGLQKSLERKAEIISKLDEAILCQIDDEDEIGEEIEASDSMQLEIQTKILEIDVGDVGE